MADAKKKTAKTDAAKESSKVADRLTDSARDLMKRTTVSAKDRADGAYDASKRYNANLEDFLVRAARGYADVLGNIADAAYANVNHSIAAAEKLAEAQSLSDAMQIQVDYVRESSSRNLENVRSAYDFAREVITENTENLREGAAKVWNSDKAA